MQETVIYILFGIILIILVFVHFIVIRKIKKTNRKVIETNIDNILKEKENLKEETSLLKEDYFEVNTQNEELRTNSEQLMEINEMILAQKKQIEIQSKNILEKNNLLTQSLKSAQRIQHSLFPKSEDIKKQLPKSAIFFQPKDIVSGDFYWMRNVDDKIYVAEVDCTGHGVPGAFMSMIGNTLLNEIIVNQKITAPQEIFQKLNESLLFIFSHEEFDDEAQDEGMDLTLAVIDRTNSKIDLISAMQNFFVCKNNEISIFKGDIFSIGGFISRMKKPVYTVYEFAIEEGLRIFLSSDGFVDQFGEIERDKYGVERFNQLLYRSRSMSIELQIEHIKESFNKWKSTHEQMDDVLILGFEF